MAVAGEGVLPRMFMAPKSVWVSSFEGGPRSCVGGGFDLEGAGDTAWRYVETDRLRRDLGGRLLFVEPRAKLCRPGRAIE